MTAQPTAREVSPQQSVREQDLVERVVRSFDVSGDSDVVTLNYALGRLDEGFYVRLRGSDGKRLAVGLRGRSVDPSGPALDVVGDADPWNDLWFYTNPMWVLPTES